MDNRVRGRSAALYVSLVGIMAASIECGKLALSFLPNVEVVTLLCALYGYVFGWAGILGAIVFVAIEPLIWGVNTWIISYIIYWPLVAAIFMLLGKARVKNRFLLAGVACILTLFFGVLTSLVDIGLFTGNYDNFFYRFSIYYVRGISFYAIQLVCNAALFPLLFPMLSGKLEAVRKRLL